MNLHFGYRPCDHSLAPAPVRDCCAKPVSVETKRRPFLLLTAPSLLLAGQKTRSLQKWRSIHVSAYRSRCVKALTRWTSATPPTSRSTRTSKATGLVDRQPRQCPGIGTLSHHISLRIYLKERAHLLEERDGQRHAARMKPKSSLRDFVARPLTAVWAWQRVLCMVHRK